VTAVYTASEGTWYGEEGDYLSHEDLLFAVIVQLWQLQRTRWSPKTKTWRDRPNFAMQEAGSASGAAEPPIRVLVITLGGDREKYIREHLEKVGGFEVYTSPGVPSRSLRTKAGLLAAAVECGLFEEDGSRRLPAPAPDANVSVVNPEYTFDDFWKDCRSINRQRAVLGCLFAHIRALKFAHSAIPGGADVVMEDNVRFLKKPFESARRIRSLQRQAPNARARLFAFGGPDSVIEELYSLGSKMSSTGKFCEFLFSNSEFRRRGKSQADVTGGESSAESGEIPVNTPVQGRGAPLVWGCFAYWVHPQVLSRFISQLQAGLPGSLLNKRNKRQKTFSIRPIDKILYDFGLPGGRNSDELTESTESRAVVSLEPCCYRAPMLPSTCSTSTDEFTALVSSLLSHSSPAGLIHRNYDAGFCCASASVM